MNTLFPTKSFILCVPAELTETDYQLAVKQVSDFLAVIKETSSIPMQETT